MSPMKKLFLKLNKYTICIKYSYRISILRYSIFILNYFLCQGNNFIKLIKIIKSIRLALKLLEVGNAIISKIIELAN